MNNKYKNIMLGPRHKGVLAAHIVFLISEFQDPKSSPDIYCYYHLWFVRSDSSKPVNLKKRSLPADTKMVVIKYSIQ